MITAQITYVVTQECIEHISKIIHDSEKKQNPAKKEEETTKQESKKEVILKN